MNSFRLDGGDSVVFHKRMSLREIREVDAVSLFILYASKLLLVLGVVLIFLNNLNVVAPGSYFGKFSWVTLIVFIIGILLNFIFIPLLYASSFKNFKKENCFWDKETFWILPSFFFGIFFLYSAEIQIATALFIFSVLIIAAVHIRFIFESRSFFIKDPGAKFVGHEEYFITLKYLTAYYSLLLILLVVYNPLQHAFFWMRMNV